MALARVHTWIAGEVLTASDLNAEFSNILNNPTSLITPLTAGLALGGFSLTGLGAGSASTPSLSFDGDTNTGIYSSGAESVDLTGRGGRVLQASGFADGVNFVRIVNAPANQSPAIEAVGTDTNVSLRLVAKGTGYVEATSFKFGVSSATQTADFEGRTYWNSAERTLHIVTGTATIARVPAIVAIQKGDLIYASGDDGATGYARLGIGTNGQNLSVNGGVPVWTASGSVNIKWANIVGTSGAINASSGVSGVVRNGAGLYTVTWSPAFSSANYAVSGAAGFDGSINYFRISGNGIMTASTIQVETPNQNGTPTDNTVVTIMAIGA